MAGLKGAWRRLGSSEAVKVGAVPALILVVALFFAFPWLPEPSPAGAALERYFPARDGGSLLVETRDADGRTISTESQNLAMIPDLRAFTESGQALGDELEKTYGFSENMEDAQVAELRRRTLEKSGRISDSTDTVVLEPRGVLLLASREGDAGAEFVFDRPAILLPADLGPGKRWRSEGNAGPLDYELDGRVTGNGAYDGELGSFDDCLFVETRTTFSRASRTDRRTSFKDTYCAGVGLVESREFDASGGLIRRSEVVATDLAPAEREAGLTPASVIPGEGVSGDPASWTLGHFGRLRPTGESTASTIAPTYVPTDPPVVLAAAQEGDLLALDAGKSPGRVRWRFHPDGTIYGPPAVDPKTGRIYFGATGKKLYALDTRGLFLWAFETGDNVASRPVIEGDTVVFGGENGNVYGLDVETGEERWRVPTGGPVVSSPAFEGGVVIVGSDDGAVYGLDPQTGRERWRHLAEGPVEAPVTATDGVAYVASRSGELTALDAGTGREVWTSPRGEILRTAPAVGDTEVYVVDDSQGLLAFDRQTGKKRWEKPDGSYVGPPLVVHDELVVALDDGRIQRLGAGGEVRGGWDGAAAAGNPIDGDPTFSIGPTSGGGEIWAASDKASVLRLGRETGPPRSAPASYGRSALGTFTEGMRELVIEDLRPGVVRFGDLPSLTRALAWTGFALLFAGVGLLFLNEFLRAAFSLLPMVGGTPGRGELVPYVLIPLTIFLFSVAWGFMLTGALRTRRVVKLAVLLLYLMVAGVWTAGTAHSIPAALLSWAALLFVPVYFFLRRRKEASPALEFGVLLVCVSLTFGVSQVYAIDAWRTTGVPGVLANVPTMIYTFDLLVIPLLLYIGVDIAEFVHKTASWTSGLTDAWAGRRALFGVLFLLLAWRLGTVTLETLGRIGKSSLLDQAAAYAGALAVPLSVGAVWWTVRRHDGEGVTVGRLLDLAKRVALPLIAVYMSLQGVEVVVTLLVGLLGLLYLGLGFGGLGNLDESVGLIAQDANWQTLLAAVALVVALIFAQRGRGTLALYLGIVGPTRSGYSSPTPEGPWTTSGGAGSCPWTSGGWQSSAPWPSTGSRAAGSRRTGPGGSCSWS